MPFLGIIYTMINTKAIFTRCILTLTVCIGAALMVGCGNSQNTEDAAVVLDSPQETGDTHDEHGNSMVEIVITPSLEPVVTPVPTPRLPETISCDPIKGYTSKSGVNLRAQPSTDAEVIDTLDKAIALTITGRAEGWCQVKVGNETGYISSEFVGEGSVPAVLTIDSLKRHNGIATASVNMRKEPSTHAGVIEKLDIFTPFTITGENNDWYEIEYKGQRGYVSKKYSEQSSGYYDSDDLYLVAQLVHQEAKYTSKEGLIAVANVVYNRLRSSKFPSTLEGVVFEEGQFSPAENRSKLKAVHPSSGAIDAVIEIFARGKTILPRNVLYFRASRMGKEWSSSRSFYGQFGGNYFYK